MPCAHASNRCLNQPPDGGKKRGERLGLQSMGEAESSMRLDRRNGDRGRNEIGFGKAPSQERRRGGWLIKPSHLTPRSNGQQAGGLHPTARGRAAPVPAVEAGRARAVPSCWHRGPGTGTVAAAPGRFCTGPNRTVPVSAQRAWPIWKTLDV